MRTSEPHEHPRSTTSDAELVDLRLRYETAYDAYQTCAFALEEAWRHGDEPAPDLLARHRETLPHLNGERARYREALVQAAFLSDDAAH